jgi:hypothetical protein
MKEQGKVKKITVRNGREKDKGKEWIRDKRTNASLWL